MERLPPQTMDPAQKKREGANYDRVMGLQEELLSASSLKVLGELVQTQLRVLFHPDRILLVQEPHDPEFPATHDLLDLSLRENRILYVPDLQEPEVFCTGQVVCELNHVFSADLSSFGLAPAYLKGLPFRSVVVLPLVSGLDTKRPVDQYWRHGALVLYSEREDMLDPLPDFGPLGMYAEYVTICYCRILKQTGTWADSTYHP